MHTCAQVKTKRDEAQHKKEQKAAERVRQAAEKASKAASAGKGRSGAGKERGGAGIGGAGRGGDGPERGVRPIDLDGGDDPPPRGKPPAPAPAHVTREASEAREALIVAAKQNQALAEQVAELQAKLAARPPDSTTAGREEGTHAPQAAHVERESAERTPMASGGLPLGCHPGGRERVIQKDASTTPTSSCIHHNMSIQLSGILPHFRRLPCRLPYSAPVHLRPAVDHASA